MHKGSVVQGLCAKGFDASKVIPFERRWRVKCSQCETLVVNGVPTHETGCPNTPRDVDKEEEC